jgi:hypothetical protein
MRKTHISNASVTVGSENLLFLSLRKRDYGSIGSWADKFVGIDKDVRRAPAG